MKSLAHGNGRKALAFAGGCRAIGGRLAQSQDLRLPGQAQTSQLRLRRPTRTRNLPAWEERSGSLNRSGRSLSVNSNTIKNSSWLPSQEGVQGSSSRRGRISLGGFPRVVGDACHFLLGKQDIKQQVTSTALAEVDVAGRSAQE